MASIKYKNVTHLLNSQETWTVAMMAAVLKAQFPDTKDREIAENALHLYTRVVDAEVEVNDESDAN